MALAVVGALAVMTFFGILLGAGHGVVPVVVAMVSGAWPASYWFFILIPTGLIMLPSMGMRSYLGRVLSTIGFLGLMVLSIVVTRQAEKDHRAFALVTAAPSLVFSIVGIGMNVFQLAAARSKH